MIVLVRDPFQVILANAHAHITEGTFSKANIDLKNEESKYWKEHVKQ